MAAELKYDQALAGAKATAAYDGAQVTTGVFNRGTIYSCKKGDYVYLTGYYYFVDGLINAQTTSGLYLINPDGNSWQFTANAVSIPSHSDRSAQALVNEIIENNKIILCNNLFCARFASRLTEEERDRVRALQERLQARNEALQAEGLIRQDSIEQNYPSGYAELSEYLDKLMAGEAVGVAISTIAWIVVACVVLAGAGTAVYYTYKRLAEESERDVEFSKELNEILMAKLTPEEYAQLKNETAGIVTKARLRQLFVNYKNILIWAVIAFAGYSAYMMIKTGKVCTEK